MTELYAISKTELLAMQAAVVDVVAMKAELKQLRQMVVDSFDVLIGTAEAAEMLGLGKAYLMRMVADGRKMPRHATSERLIVANGRVYLKNHSPEGWGKFSKADVMEWRRLFGQDHARAVNQNTHLAQSRAGV